MKTWCGFSRYQTLPNTYRSSSFSFPGESSAPIPIIKSTQLSLPPRPRVSRSFSFSESQAADTQDKHKTCHDGEENRKLTRAQSVYGVQCTSPNLIPHIYPSEYSTFHPHPQEDQNLDIQPQPPQFQSLSRSRSLASLQPPLLTSNSYKSNPDKGPPDQSSNCLRSRAPSIGHIYQNTKTEHAGIWSRGRRAESCRNLRDLNDHDAASWPGSSKPLGIWPTKVEPPMVPIRMNKQGNESPSQSSSSSLGGWSEDSSCCQNSSSSSDSGRGSDTKSARWRTSLTSPQSSSWTRPTDKRSEIRVPCLNFQEITRRESLSASLLFRWLSSLQFSCYHSLFLSAGYDLPTISRMTPEDLTAIGIQHPAHRKKLKQAISQLNIPDGLPDFIPATLSEWLRMIRLEEYGPDLLAQGYTTVQAVTTISIEDLEDIGFYRLGHQKRLLLAIKKMKEVLKETRDNAHSYLHKSQDSKLPALQPTNTRRTFDSFHLTSAQDQGSPLFSHESYKLPSYNLLNSPHRQLEKETPFVDSSLPINNHETTLGKQEEMLQPMPEPMQPFYRPLYLQARSHSFTSEQKLPLQTLSMFKDSNNSEKDHSMRGAIKQKGPKGRPIAKVAANSRNCQNDQKKQIKQMWDITDGQTSISSNNHPLVQRNSLTGPISSPSPAIIRRKTLCDSSPSLTLKCDEPLSPTTSEKPKKTRNRSAGDVLQDIGSMLSDLTDELDAMLNKEEVG